MAWFMLSITGGLVLLTGVSIYSALVVAKKTDELLERMKEDEEVTVPFVVKFPDSAFQANNVAPVQKQSIKS